jgi:hypothetical protein
VPKKGAETDGNQTNSLSDIMHFKIEKVVKAFKVVSFLLCVIAMHSFFTSS